MGPLMAHEALRRAAAASVALADTTRADLRGLWSAPQASRGFRSTEGTANAVWVRAHPGFKSPSLRS